MRSFIPPHGHRLYNWLSFAVEEAIRREADRVPAVGSAIIVTVPTAMSSQERMA